MHHTGALQAGGGPVNLDDSIIPGYARLAEAVHAEGGCMLAQLGHSAATLGSTTPGSPAWAPSAVVGDLARQVPHVMTGPEIDEIVEAHGAASSRVRAGGLDGVEILAAFGFLPAAFLSPHSNRREDNYGGSLENRLRLLLEIIEAVRAAIGTDLILGVRVPGDELLEGGLSASEMQAVARELARNGRVDYLNVIAGTNMSRTGRAEHWPPTPAPHGLFVELAAGIKEAVGLPVFAVGRIVNPDHAEAIVAAGKADMVGMTRAHIADPELVTKLWEERVDDVRPCVGANVCIRNGFEGRPISCIYNPETSRESTWGTAGRTAQPKQVVVVGGGPAGLEAARVCALRGHRVALYERDTELGGQLRLWSGVPSMRELGGIIVWQRRQLEKHQVHVHLGQTFSPERARASGADVIILATGSKPHVPEVPGAEDAEVRIASAIEILEQPPTSGKVVVWDSLGGGVGVGTAEVLSAAGCGVQVVSPQIAVAEDITVTLRVPLYKRLRSTGVQLIPNTTVTRVEGRDVLLQNIYTMEESRIDAIDVLVPWHGNRANDELAEALRSQGLDVRIIGDCLAPREMDIAVTEGAMVAREI